MRFRDILSNMIEDYELFPEDICSLFKIPLKKYNDFVSGNFNYSTSDFANLNSAYYMLGKESLKNNLPFKVLNNNQLVLKSIDELSTLLSKQNSFVAKGEYGSITIRMSFDNKIICTSYSKKIMVERKKFSDIKKAQSWVLKWCQKNGYTVIEKI